MSFNDVYTIAFIFHFTGDFLLQSEKLAIIGFDQLIHTTQILITIKVFILPCI